MRATYCPEDNKIRVYPEGTRVDSVLDDTEYAEFKSAGFKWASKQECFVCPRWTTAAEDWAIELADDGEIGDEDYSPEERSADRAERFNDYRDKRADEAGASADAFEQGPQVFGHQNRGRAERQARRHDRHRVNAVTQWRKAEYWHERTAGVIGHALHKSSAPVRRGRIKTLETDQRKFLAGIEESQRKYDAWTKVATMEGADQRIPLDEEGYSIVNPNPAQRLAYTLANSNCWAHFWHPTNDEVNAKAKEIWHHGLGPYDLLAKNSFAGVPMERLTPKQVAEMYLANYGSPAESVHNRRWIEHYELRLTYERAMLANEGGSATDVEMEAGGFVNIRGEWRQIQKVNRSTATGRVVSVQLWGTSTGYTKESNYTKSETRPCLCNVNIERKGEAVYRAPTDEERHAFQGEKKAKKAAPVPLINPTDEDAERLQAYLNEREKKRDEETKTPYSKSPEPVDVHRTTQATYSRLSGENSFYFINQYTINGSTFKVRSKRRGFVSRGANPVVILTDKPQKPLPVKWDTPAAEPTQTQPVAPPKNVPTRQAALPLEMITG